MTINHEMTLDMTHPSGMQDWHCPICGRHIQLLVPPDNKMVVVEPGDQSIGHFGSTGGLHISAVQVKEQDEEIPEESLAPWVKAIDKLDLTGI